MVAIVVMSLFAPWSRKCGPSGPTDLASELTEPHEFLRIEDKVLLSSTYDIGDDTVDVRRRLHAAVEKLFFCLIYRKLLELAASKCTNS